MDDEQHGERREEKNGSRWPIGRRGFAIGATASALGAATLALDAQQSELVGESDEETADCTARPIARPDSHVAENT